MIWLRENAGGHRVLPDGRHSEVGGSGAAVAFDASVEAGEFAFSGFQADLKALDFAEPAVHPCFGDALAQVVDDLGEAGPLLGRHAEHCASQAPLTELSAMFRQFIACFRSSTLPCPRDRIR